MKSKIFNYLKEKKIVLLGLARSNLAIVKLLEEFNIPFSVCDQLSKIDDNININENVELHLGKDYMDYLESDLIFRSPGVPYFSENIINAINKGTEVISEIELFLNFCPCTSIGITGSDGKTTVTVIISEILKKMDKNVFIGGNIGNPLIPEISKINKDSAAVIELSSFQLISMKKSPDISIITNISPNHLDIHKDFDEYISAKQNIYKYQKNDSILVLNYDDKIVSSCEKESKSNIIFFSMDSDKINKSVFLYFDKIKQIIMLSYNNKKIEILNKKDIKISGKHNIKNYMAAICAVFGYLIRNETFEKYFKKSKDAIISVAKEFIGVEHRIEFVREIGGIKYYNDSIATSPNRTIKGTLEVFDKNLIIICGGYDKNLNYNELGSAFCGGEFNNKKYLSKVKILILMGQTADKIEEAVNKSTGKSMPQIFRAKDMDEAIFIAHTKGIYGDTVVLSPASASFDLYKNFEEKGNHFKEIINNL